MSQSRPDEGALRVAFAAEQNARTAALETILQRASRLKRWMSQPVDPDLKAQLAEDRRRLADELLDCLAGWNELGGRIQIGDGDLGPDASVDSLRAGARAGGTVVALPPPVESPVVRRPVAPISSIVSRPPAAAVDSLRGLSRHFEAGGQVRNEGVSANWEELLAKIVTDLGVPSDDADGELLVLFNVVREADRWRGLPRDVQRTLVGLVTARLRRAQDEMGIGGSRLDDTFSMLSAWSKREQPGWVNGLSRGHGPTRGTWGADAEAYTARLPAAEAPPAVKENHERLLGSLGAFLPEFETAPPEALDSVKAQFRSLVRKALDAGVRSADPRLLKLSLPHADLFDGVEFRGLRKALREDAEAAEGEDDEKAPPLPPDWAWWGRTRYRRGVIVGGDPRELNRERLEKAFGFGELEWVGTEFKRNNLQTVRDRVRAGKIDIVIILGSFVGHDADEVILPAARECGVDWVHVDKGYGIVRVRRAMERFLDPLASR